MGNIVTCVCAKFRNYSLRINKALGIFQKGNNNPENNNNHRSALGYFRSKNTEFTEMYKKAFKAAQFSVVHVLIKQEQRRNEVFIDVIERLTVSIAADVSYAAAGWVDSLYLIR